MTVCKQGLKKKNAWKVNKLQKGFTICFQNYSQSLPRNQVI